MLPLIAFFIAGFFMSPWPWGVATAAVVQAIGMALGYEKYIPWWHRSKRQLAQILAMQLVSAIALHTAAMGLGFLLARATGFFT